QVLGVEGDLHTVTLDRSVDLALVVAHLVSLGGNRYRAGYHAFAGRHYQTHDARAVTGEDRGDAGLSQKLADVGDSLGAACGGNELAEVGKGPLDQLSHHLDVGQRE